MFLYVVYVNGEGFISAFDKMKNRYKTTKNVSDADFNSTFEQAQFTADFFNGVVLAVKDEENH